MNAMPVASTPARSPWGSPTPVKAIDDDLQTQREQDLLLSKWGYDQKNILCGQEIKSSYVMNLLNDGSGNSVAPEFAEYPQTTHQTDETIPGVQLQNKGGHLKNPNQPEYAPQLPTSERQMAIRADALTFISDMPDQKPDVHGSILNAPCDCVVGGVEVSGALLTGGTSTSGMQCGIKVGNECRSFETRAKEPQPKELSTNFARFRGMPFKSENTTEQFQNPSGFVRSNLQRFYKQ